MRSVIEGLAAAGAGCQVSKPAQCGCSALLCVLARACQQQLPQWAAKAQCSRLPWQLLTCRHWRAASRTCTAQAGSGPSACSMSLASLSESLLHGRSAARIAQRSLLQSRLTLQQLQEAPGAAEEDLLLCGGT